MSACQADKSDSASAESSQTLPSYPQRTGDADAGLGYLLYGDYLGSGIPTEILGATWKMTVETFSIEREIVPLFHRHLRCLMLLMG